MYVKGCSSGLSYASAGILLSRLSSAWQNSNSIFTLSWLRTRSFVCLSISHKCLCLPARISLGSEILRLGVVVDTQCGIDIFRFASGIPPHEPACLVQLSQSWSLPAIVGESPYVMPQSILLAILLLQSLVRVYFVVALCLLERIVDRRVAIELA